MNSWGNSPTRIDLKKGGEVVLIELKDGEWVPFEIISHDIENRKVEGKFLLTNDVRKIRGGTPSKPMSEGWKWKYIEKLENELDRVTDCLNLIRDLKIK